MLCGYFFGLKINWSWNGQQEKYVFIIHLLPHCPSIHIYEIKCQPNNHHSYFYDSLFLHIVCFSAATCIILLILLCFIITKKKLKEFLNKAWGQNINHSLTFCNAHFSASKNIQQQYPFKIHGVRCAYLMCNLASTTYLFYYVCSILCS